jgi:ATP-dependent phosphoenolpyruvate carboxykinase
MNHEATDNNYFTYPDRRPSKSKDNGEINEILEKNIQLPFIHIVDICGAKIQLRTNSKHVSDWWQLNWNIIDSSSEPDGIVYVINGIKGHEPHLFYNIDERKVLIVNSEYYGAAKSAGALGLASIILEEKGKYPVHGASVGLVTDGEFLGVVIIAPTGTGKTTQFHELLYNVKSSKVVGDDYLFVSFDENKKEVIAEQPEKQLYMRTEIAEKHPTFIKSFEGLPIENVVVKKEECRQKSDDIQKMGTCYQTVFEKKRKCIFDDGADRCYWSYPNSRVMFPRERFTMIIADDEGNVKEVFKEKENVVDKVKLKYVLLLTRDEESPPIRKLECKEAIKILKEGKFKIMPGAGPPEKWGQYGNESFYDPYQLEMNKEREEEFFRKLFENGINVYLLNTGSYQGRKIEIHQTHAYIRAALKLN